MKKENAACAGTNCRSSPNGLVALAGAGLPQRHPASRRTCSAHIFGPNNVFVEIQRHRIRGEERANQALASNSRDQFRLPLLATNGVLYATEAERPILDVFTCIRNHTHLDAAGTLLEQNSERYLKSAAQMRELFRDLPEAIRQHRSPRRAVGFHARKSRLRISRVSRSCRAKRWIPFCANRPLPAPRNVTSEVPDKVRDQLETRTGAHRKSSRSPAIFSSSGTSWNFAARTTSWPRAAAARPTAPFVFASASPPWTRSSFTRSSNVF